MTTAWYAAEEIPKLLLIPPKKKDIDTDKYKNSIFNRMPTICYNHFTQKIACKHAQANSHVRGRN